jgi:hypothetical protein
MKQIMQESYKILNSSGITPCQSFAITKAIKFLSSNSCINNNSKAEIIKLNEKIEQLFTKVEMIELRMIIKLGSIISVATSLLFASLKIWL